MALVKCNGNIMLTELVYDDTFLNKTEAELKIICDDQKSKVIGFKRVIK